MEGLNGANGVASLLAELGDGDENPLPLIDTGEHNHLQLLLLVSELKEHNARSDSLLAKTSHYIKAQEAHYQTQLEEERRQHQTTKQQLAITARKLADSEQICANLAQRNRKLELIIGHVGDEADQQNSDGAGNSLRLNPFTSPKSSFRRFSLKSLSWSEKSRKAAMQDSKSKNLQEEIRQELKFIQEVAAIKIQACVRGWLVRIHFRKMISMNAKRNNIVRELYETEKSYVRNISVLVKVFIKPLHESIQQGSPILEPKLVNHIFSVTEPVLVAHDILMTMMERRLKTWSSFQKFGDVFLKDYMNNFQSVYSTYINNYNRAFATLNKCMADNKVFAQFVKQSEAKKECEMHDLLSFLIMPIQRIPRYKMLLMDLLKNTWESHVDYVDIKNALIRITEIASILNEKKRESESAEKSEETKEKEKKDRELAQRSLRRNTAILEDLSSLLRTSATWSDSETDDSSLPPGSPEAIPEFTEAQIDDLMLRMMAPNNGIPTGKNVYHLRVYEQTFPGAAMVSWLAEHYPQLSRSALASLGQMLLERGTLTTIKADQKGFRDSKTTLFRFKLTDKKESTLNIPKQWLGPAGRDAIVVANALAVITIDIIGKHLSPDKKSVNFEKMVSSQEFIALSLQTAELQRVEISHLHAKQKMIFFINLYNSLLVHSHATQGAPKTSAAAKALAERVNYVISGHKYSLEDIEQLILGGVSHFKKKSSKLQNIIPHSARDFMVVFSMATGTVDAPPMLAYDSDIFERQIQASASSFLQKQIEIKASTNEMLLPTILWTRKADVWKDHKDLIAKIWPLLADSQRAELTKMMADKGKLEFKWKPQSFIPCYIPEQVGLVDGTEGGANQT